MVRERNVWKVIMLRNGQQQVETEFKAHWDPEKVASEDIAGAAAVIETVRSSNNKDDRVQFLPVSAQLVPREAEAAAS